MMPTYTRTVKRGERRAAEGKTVKFIIFRFSDGSKYLRIAGTDLSVQIPKKHSAKGKALRKLQQILLAKKALAS